MKMDETLYSIQEKVQNFAVIYLVDIVKVPDFNKARPPGHALPAPSVAVAGPLLLAELGC